MLTYGCDSLYLNEHNKMKLDSTQGALIKQSLGLGKRSHHSHLLRALDMCTISKSIKRQSLMLYYRIFSIDSPCRDLCSELLYKFMSTGRTVNGTLLHRIVCNGYSPILAAFIDLKSFIVTDTPHYNGIVDTMKYLLCQDNFIKLYAEEHVLLSLLTLRFFIIIAHLCNHIHESICICAIKYIM